MISSKGIAKISVAWMIVTTCVVFIPSISAWIATPFVLVGIIFVPGLLLAVNLGIHRKSILEYIPYSLGLGLGFVIIGGLALNWVLPHAGVSAPLARVPLIVFFNCSVLVLAVIAYKFKTVETEFEIGWPDVTSVLFGTVPLLFVVANVVGAERLNNGQNGIMTLTTLACTTIYFLILSCQKKQPKEWVYIWSLYCTSLSLLLMYSLRSSHIFGWDINQEYQVFQATLQHLVWKVSYYPNFDYNACLSITILPTILKVLTNISSEYVFKITYQLIFAAVPALVYLLCKRYLTQNLAFVAAFLLLSQRWFYEQMPALIRQEIAFIFYIFILIALFDTDLSKRTRYTLLSIFTTALVLSHYSTTYIWIAVMFGGLAMSYPARFFIKSLRKQKPVISPIILIFTIIILAVWEIPVTHTGSALSKFATNQNPLGATKPAADVPPQTVQHPENTSDGINIDTKTIAHDAPAAQADTMAHKLIQQLSFATTNPNSQTNLEIAYQKIINAYGNPTKYDIYSDGSNSHYMPRVVNNTAHMSPQINPSLSTIIRFAETTSKIVLIDMFPIAGIIVLCLRLRKRESSTTYDLILINMSALGLITLTLLVPYLQDYYNLTRLYLQMFILICMLSIVGGMALLKSLPRYQIEILACIVAIMFCSQSGLFEQFTGGEKRLTLNSLPGNLDIYYTYDSDIAGAKWLAKNRDPIAPIQSDIISSLRLQSFGDIAAGNFAILPQTLRRNSYVYLTNLNINSGKNFYQYENNLLIFNYPLEFLDSHKNLIYSAGGSRIYR
ncbi:MAG: Protein of unknown function rane [Candidatus Parcubacteria bacterium]|nr:Protein of unknown function rane [Candidatus Parcubacteria bacterium]